MPRQRAAAAITSRAVGGDDDGGAGGAGLAEELEEDVAARRVEAVERLVGEQDAKGRTRARAIEAFWRMPRLNSEGSESSHSARPRRSSSSAIRASASSVPCRAAT